MNSKIEEWSGGLHPAVIPIRDDGWRIEREFLPLERPLSEKLFFCAEGLQQKSNENKYRPISNFAMGAKVQLICLIEGNGGVISNCL